MSNISDQVEIWKCDKAHEFKFSKLFECLFSFNKPWKSYITIFSYTVFSMHLYHIFMLFSLFFLRSLYAALTKQGKMGPWVNIWFLWDFFSSSLCFTGKRKIPLYHKTHTIRDQTIPFKPINWYLNIFSQLSP